MASVDADNDGIPGDTNGDLVVNEEDKPCDQPQTDLVRRSSFRMWAYVAGYPVV